MALWPNGRYMTRSTYKGYGVAPGLDARIKANGDRYNRFLSLNQTASTPDGYGDKTFIPPITAGSMSALRPIAVMDEGTSELLQGGPMEGAAPVAELTGTSGLSLVVGLAANVAVATLTGNSMVLRLTVGLNGTGEFTLTGTNNLALIVPFEGAGSVVTMGDGATDLRGLLSMEGEWTPFTELSPEGLARAVWESILAEYTTSGTAGYALSTASSGGVDLAALAAAVLAAAQSTPIHADVRKMNSYPVAGSGTSGDLWRGV